MSPFRTESSFREADMEAPVSTSGATPRPVTQTDPDRLHRFGWSRSRPTRSVESARAEAPDLSRVK